MVRCASAMVLAKHHHLHDARLLLGARPECDSTFGQDLAQMVRYASGFAMRSGLALEQGLVLEQGLDPPWIAAWFGFGAVVVWSSDALPEYDAAFGHDLAQVGKFASDFVVVFGNCDKCTDAWQLS
ncbi:hypothetical protein U1Q18_015205 [Sarracenia purpurea var. burkii]